MKRINIAVLGGESPSWEAILAQEGVPHSHGADRADSSQTSVTVAPLNPSGMFDKAFKESLAAGIPGFCTGGTLMRLSGVRIESLRIKYLLEQSHGIFARAGLTDIDSACVVPPGANCLPSERGSDSAFTGEFGGAPVVALPFDPAGLSQREYVCTRSFYAERSRLPFERVAGVAKGGARILLATSLEHLHHRSGMPYAHLWYYPGTAPSVFCFRVDTDFASLHEIEQLYALARKHGIPFTWFVHVKAQEKFLDLFREMEGHETGVHCYEHVRYDDPAVIAPDLKKAMQLLNSAGIRPQGFAAPYGYWSKAVEAAASEFSFAYSSEFCRDYDNLPSLAEESGRKGTLQLPVHPVSIGALRRQGFSSGEMRAYFSDVIERKLASRQPLTFYHHPKDGHHEVLEYIFNLVQSRNVPVMTMGAYAAWWKMRSERNLQITVDGERLLVAGPSASQDLLLRLSRPDGLECFFRPDPEISLSAAHWETRPAPLAWPADIRRIRKFNPWMPLIRLQDACGPKRT